MASARLSALHPGGFGEAAVGLAVEEVGQQDHTQLAPRRWPTCGLAMTFLPGALDDLANLGVLDVRRQRRVLGDRGGATTTSAPACSGQRPGQHQPRRTRSQPARGYAPS